MLLRYYGVSNVSSLLKACSFLLGQVAVAFGKIFRIGYFVAIALFLVGLAAVSDANKCPGVAD